MYYTNYMYMEYAAKNNLFISCYRYGLIVTVCHPMNLSFSHLLKNLYLIVNVLKYFDIDSTAWYKSATYRSTNYIHKYIQNCTLYGVYINIQGICC